MNIKLLCKGCCKNVYSTGMLLNMGAGRKAYILIYGQQAKMNSLVDIFAFCPIEESAIAPAFGKIGLGIQCCSSVSVENLLKKAL